MNITKYVEISGAVSGAVKGIKNCKESDFKGVIKICKKNHTGYIYYQYHPIIQKGCVLIAPTFYNIRILLDSKLVNTHEYNTLINEHKQNMLDYIFIVQ